jgi:hypothetical protein
LTPFTLEDKADPESVILGELPGYIQNYFFAFLSKDFVLTYNSATDMKLLENKLEGVIEAFEMSLPPGKFGWDTIRDLDNLRVVVFNRARRALNGFERKQENSFSNEYTYRQYQQPMNTQQPGIVSRLGSTIFGGGR